MDRFFYEIVSAPDGAVHVPAVQALIAGNATLAAASEPWTRLSRPAQADLYALLVVASDGLASDPESLLKVAHASAGGFPLLPIVEDRATFDFRRAPLTDLTERNAEALNDPDRLVRSLLHHAGIELFEGGGHVFISYARADGSALADAVRDALRDAGIGRTMDVYAFAGGDLIQDDIDRRIRAADLVVLIDSAGAARSPWVAEELDIATAAHVQAVAVTPVAGAFHHAFEVPHVAWAPGADVASEVLYVARRVLARKLAFRARVERVLRRLARFRDWTLTDHSECWRVHPRGGRVLTVACVPGSPHVEDVTILRDAVAPERALLVAGVRPLQPVTERSLHEAGRGKVYVSPLPTMAAKVPAHLARRPLARVRVFLSASMPSEPDDVELARLTLGSFVAGLAQAMVDLGATLVLGGHPSVTPLMHKAVHSMIRRKGAGGVELHQARRWQGVASKLPATVREGPIFRNVRWHGDGRDDGGDVIALRDGMIDPSLDAAVFVGGKTSGFIGLKPGIVDEHERFVRVCGGKPVFVVGLAAGAARALPSQETSLAEALRTTADPDLAVALIVAELLGL